MALRRCAGFRRYMYTLSIQYHGAIHLGIAYQGDGFGEKQFLLHTCIYVILYILQISKECPYVILLHMYVVGHMYLGTLDLP